MNMTWYRAHDFIHTLSDEHPDTPAADLLTAAALYFETNETNVIVALGGAGTWDVIRQRHDFARLYGTTQ